MENKETVLVTGGTGFVGVHTILQLLQKGYNVRTTLRSLKRKDEIITMLKNGGIASFEHIEFIEADLTKDDNWDKAVKGCDYVLHVASPFPQGEPKDENELIIPAKKGTLRVLKAAENAGVKRVVMTSSFGAVGYSIDPKNHVFTEQDWTDPNTNLAAYIKSKTVAELAAWDFIKNNEGNLELTVINPVGIFGTVLGNDLSSSVQLVEQLLTGKMKATPKLNFSVVDVRDVADLHILAMKNPEAKGQRFLAASDGATSLPKIAELLRSQPHKFGNKVTSKVLPDWLVKILSVFKPELKSVSSQLGITKKISNDKAKKMLGWQPRNWEATIVDTAESLMRINQS
ncbi:aldehyde reductase [Marinilongibacter aquaticus]|uniref:SDR family oxidoreductase n=1 Tax=Marinilongibacter aquaticus TaxID=2975157 RepID=UPI0021BD8B58|nr:aldehyde reductase [Marinilongibacter aquaticus]UBM59580.1 aldehyde reductase [Marinilongibacter aquaticus]